MASQKSDRSLQCESFDFYAERISSIGLGTPRRAVSGKPIAARLREADFSCLIQPKINVEGGTLRRIYDPPQITGDLGFQISGRGSEPARVRHQRIAFDFDPGARASLRVENQGLCDPDGRVLALSCRKADRLLEGRAGHENLRRF
jgi:hypothetical protein